MRNYKLLVVLVLSALLIPRLVSAQMFKADQWSLQVNGGLNQPLGELGNWFKSTYNVTGGVTQGFSNNFAVEYRLHYTNFDKEGNGGGTKYPIPRNLELYFRSVGITLSPLYTFFTSSSFNTYIVSGFGIYRWDSKRGAGIFQPVPTTSAIVIKAKVRTQYALGFNGGLGVAIAAGSKAFIDINVRWEGIMSTLWPTLYLGLEKVEPMQAIGVNAGIRFIL